MKSSSHLYASSANAAYLRVSNERNVSLWASPPLITAFNVLVPPLGLIQEISLAYSIFKKLPFVFFIPPPDGVMKLACLS